MRTSLRAKLVRTMTATLIVVSTATLLVVAGMSTFASQKTLKTIEAHLRASIEDRGSRLVTNQALGLRDLVMDNAFSDVGRLVERTLGGGQAAGIRPFPRRGAQGLGLCHAARATKGVADWKQLAIDGRARRTRACRSSTATCWGRTCLNSR